MESGKPLGYMLDRSLRVFKNQLVSEFRRKENELTYEQFVILHLLNSDCDLIQRDLANKLQKDKSIIVRQINSLIDNQFVVRITNKEDKRIKNLILTKKGFEKLNQMKEIASELSKKLLTGVTETDLEIFRNVLAKIQENGGAEEELCNCGLNQPK
ncbi:MAG: MarR family winged helix-turn-helix transcriptional regulator [Bacteroidia bacterium]|nr:MarR family winged helix-turn-helix transcriptional regulator [Bacteroidia bacterium]